MSLIATFFVYSVVVVACIYCRQCFSACTGAGHGLLVLSVLNLFVYLYILISFCLLEVTLVFVGMLVFRCCFIGHSA